MYRSDALVAKSELHIRLSTPWHLASAASGSYNHIFGMSLVSQSYLMFKGSINVNKAFSCFRLVK